MLQSEQYAKSVYKQEEESEIYTHECTSWMAFCDLTKNKTNILHKNRDAKWRNLLPLKSQDGSPRKWIGLGNIEATEREGNVCMGINASGLGAVVNSGEHTVELSDSKADLGTPAILRICLSECDTAAEAVQKLEEIRQARRYSHGQKGSIFIFMDLKEAFIVEMTAERSSVQHYDHGYAFRANIWHNPDMAIASANPTEKWLNSANREYMVIRDFNRAIRTNGKFTISDSLEISRDTETPEGSGITRTLCSQTTNSASTLEISLIYPDVLSTGYFLIGPPRHTLFVPIPICVEKYHPTMNNLTWSSAAWKSFDEKGFGIPIPANWADFESHSLERYKDAQKNAEILLNEGKKPQAVRLLNDTAYAIWEEAAKIMELPRQ